MKDRAALYLIKEAEEKGLYHLLLIFFIILGANSYMPIFTLGLKEAL